mmetsp:Transcript_633/g.1123  ORF Transcript_633/g.1123 Transcript_633/m.1123 type:complete len:178 (+) Transcript_633:149-682(+)
MEPFGRRFQAHFEWGELSSTDAERKKVSSHHDISLHEAASCATLRARVLCCSLVTSPIIACASRLISGCGFVCLSLAPFIDQGVVEVSIGTGEERLNYLLTWQAQNARLRRREHTVRDMIIKWKLLCCRCARTSTLSSRASSSGFSKYRLPRPAVSPPICTGGIPFCFRQMLESRSE